VRADVRGALSAGIRPVLIDRHQHAHGRPATTAAGEVVAEDRAIDVAVPIIADLNGLLDLLDVPRPAGITAS
jgi:hypothetical protein